MTDAADVRRDVKQWLADNWDPDLTLLEWRTKLVESGWATPTWPAEWYGRGLPGWADPIVHEEFAAIGAVGTAVGLAHTARHVLTQHDSHVIDGLATITAPTLVVVGADDAPFVKGSHYMADKIPNADLVVIDGCGHAPPITHPQPFNAALRTFLEGLS